MSNVSYLQLQQLDDTGDLPPFIGAPEGGTRLLSFRQVFQVLWRRKFLILAVMALISSLAFYWVQTRTPLYVAGAEVEIGIGDQRALDIQDVLQQSQQDYYYNETQAAIIASSFAAEQVAERLGLFADPSPLTWNEGPSLSPVEAIRSAARSALPEEVLEGLRGLADSIAGAPAEDRSEEDAIAAMSPEERAAFERQNVVNTLLAGLSVDPSERARTIQVSFLSDKPAFARLVANAFAEVYVDSTRIEKTEATTRASTFLRDEVERLRAQYRQSEQRLEQFRRELGSVDTRGQTTLLQEQLVDLNRDLVTARQEAAAAAARVSQMRRLLSEGEQGIETVTSVLDSPLIVRLREQEAEVVREIAELRTQLRERHPRLLLKRAELDDLQQKIRGEISKIVVALENDLELARVKERNLEREVQRLQDEVKQRSNAEVTRLALQSERDANKALYETVLTRFNEINLQERSPQQANARVITPAAMPLEPSYPRKSLTMAAALVGSAILGILLVLLLEYMDAGFRSLEQLQERAYVAALGLVPRLSVIDARRSSPEDFVIDEPNSLYAEAIRTIRTSLMLSSIDERPRSVMFTSSVPAEGKTATAVSLARAAAKAGQRTVIVDCDLRKPSVHDALRVPNGQGVVEILIGAASLDDVIEIDLRSGLHYITAGAKAPNPPDALGSSAMHQLIAELSMRYDLVVLDTPPVLPVSDALVLLRHVDKVVFLVRWGTTRREAVLAGIRQVQEANGDIAGVALTRVDIRRHRRYSYADAYSYSGYGQSYGA